MKFWAKAVVSLLMAALSLLFCGGCEDYDDIIKGLEKTDISYIMKTDLTCVHGEELYIKTSFYPSSDILIRYENPVYFDGRRLYFFRHSITEAETDEEKAESGAAVAPRTAVICCYDTEKSEIELILEEENKKHIGYSFAAFKDSYLYYYRTEQKSGGASIDTAALYRIGIEEKKAEKIAEVQTINGSVPWQKGVWAGDCLYFEQQRYSDEDIIHTVYSYNTRNGKYEEFKTGVRNLMRYGSGIAYIKDGGVYYYDPAEGGESEIYVPAEKESGESIAYYSNGEKIFYQLIIKEEEKASVEIGFISDGKKKTISRKIKDFNRFSLMEGGQMFLMTLTGGENIIYDGKYNCLASISLNREEHQGCPSGDSVMFVCYDRGGQNPIFYLYSREKPKVQLPTAANAQKDNLLERS